MIKSTGGQCLSCDQERAKSLAEDLLGANDLLGASDFWHLIRDLCPLLHWLMLFG